MKAVALISGGLDGLLAAKLIQSQGIKVVGLHLIIPFCKHGKNSPYVKDLKNTVQGLGVKFRAGYLGEEFLKVVKTPKRGYGKNLNPCIDCKILMFREAKKFMKAARAEFIISGEVLGQRPMSQNRQSLNLIEKESGLEGILLRPLSAKLFELTVPEKKGRVKRAQLLEISGRGRKEQLALAKKLGVKKYPQPAGGCLLTDASFCKRLKELIKHKEYNLDNIELLKAGRHFRVSPRFKLVVGRNEKENEAILKLAKRKDFIFEPKKLAGPTALGRGVMGEEEKRTSAQIIARYTILGEPVKIKVGREEVSVKNIEEKHLKELMI